MAVFQSPFQFGTLATEENFIDRTEDRALLKQLLASHINVMLISPRRWGKIVACQEGDDGTECGR